jgi:molybdopterin-containing oxidoreductase family membrane subunit
MNFIKKIVPMKDFTLKSLFQFEKTPFNIFMFIVTVALLAAFGWGVTDYLIHGESAYGVYRQHRWGLLIAMYIFFVVSSTGLCIVGSLGDVFGFKDYMAMSKRAILGSIVTILAGFAVIAFEIGHPVTMLIYNVLSPGLTSAIWWMGTLYGLYLTFMIIEFVFLMRNDMKNARIFGLTGLLVGLAAHSNLGGVFGFLNTRLVANGVFYPTYFILTAFITGIYLTYLMYGVRYKMQIPDNIKTGLIGLAKIQTLLLAILMFFETWKNFTAIYGGVIGRADTAEHILHSATFLYGEVLCGMLIPFVLMLVTKWKAINLYVYTSFIGMVGIFFMRYDLVDDAQLKPLQMMKITEYQLPPKWIEYFPSAAEFAIGFGAIGIFFMLYYFGQKIFDLDGGNH